VDTTELSKGGVIILFMPQSVEHGDRRAYAAARYTLVDSDDSLGECKYHCIQCVSGRGYQMAGAWWLTVCL
jgi:hypothetical protein